MNALPEITTPDLQDAPVISPGAKLLCINDSNIQRSYSPGPPVRGKIYCVREVYDDVYSKGVLLVGITGPIQHGLECGFYLSRFRWVHD